MRVNQISHKKDINISYIYNGFNSKTISKNKLTAANILSVLLMHINGKLQINSQYIFFQKNPNINNKINIYVN